MPLRCGWGCGAERQGVTQHVFVAGVAYPDGSHACACCCSSPRARPVLAALVLHPHFAAALYPACPQVDKDTMDMLRGMNMAGLPGITVQQVGRGGGDFNKPGGFQGGFQQRGPPRP